MKPFLSTIADNVIRHRKTVIFLSVIITLIATVKIPSLSFTSGEEIWFRSNSPELKDYQQSHKLFGKNMQMTLSYGRQSTVDEKKFLEELEEALMETGWVKSVDSLLNKNAYSENKYLSKDKDFALIFINLEVQIGGKHLVLSNLLTEIEDWLAVNKPDAKYHMSGAALNGRLQINNDRDRKLIGPLFTLAVPVFLFLLFRRVVSSIVIFPVIILSSAGTMGLIGWLGWKMNVLNSIIMLIIMTVTVAGSVHVFADFFRHQNELGSKEAAKRTVQDLMFPCFITSLTTAIGFFSLALTSELQPMVEFGVCAGTGVLLAFLGIMFLLPALLSYSKPKAVVEFTHSGRFLSRLSDVTPGQGVLMTLVLLFLFSAGLYSGTLLEADSSLKNFFRKSSVAHQDIEHFEQKYGGLVSIDLITFSDSGFEGNQTLLTQIGETVNEHVLVERVLTPYLFEKNKGISSDGQAVLTRILLKVSDDSEIDKVSDALLAKCRNQYTDYQFTMTGKMILLSKMNKFITDGMRHSLSLSLLLISVCLLIFLRNLKDSLSAILLSTVPVLAAAILMYFLEIQLNLTSMIIAATCFSIAVDDSIHIVSRYRKLRNQEGREDSLRLSLQQCGRPVLYTSLILAIGFGLNFLGHHQPTREFGILGCTIILMAVVSDILGFTALHKTQSFFLKRKLITAEAKS